MGACADGLCFAVETRRRLAYHGGCYNGTSCPDRNVYSDESSTNWRNQDCNSGTAWNQNECGSGGNAPSCTSTDRDGPNGDPAGTTDCDDGSISQPYNERGGYYTEPGVQVYEDPDPQSSPILPRPFYPVPEEYAGTQGVYVNGRPVVTPPSDGAGPPRAGATAPAARGCSPLAPRDPDGHGGAPHGDAPLLTAGPPGSPVGPPWTYGEATGRRGFALIS